MEKKIGSEALQPNPALEPFKVFVGQWQTIGSHPYLPGITLHGRTTFDWLAGGAFLIMHTEIDHPSFPDGVAIFGSDDVAKTYFQLSFDVNFGIVWVFRWFGESACSLANDTSALLDRLLL